MNVLPDIIIALAGGALVFGFDWSLRYVILPIFASAPEYKPARSGSTGRIRF